MLLTFYYNSSHPEPRTDVKYVLSTLNDLQKKGVKCEIKNTEKMTKKELGSAYIDAVMPAVYNRYNARKAFGTNRQSGIFFGKEQPALVLKDGKRWDVYPHIENEKLVSIEDCLRQLVRPK